jgi:thiol-disulfide isomerase/thioredoxin
MKSRTTFAGIAVLAAISGAAAWWASRVPREQPAPTATAPEISSGAIWAVAFKDAHGDSRSLAEFQGQVTVVNFWATWCVPCREEMPGFVRLQERWKERGVRFVGLSDDEPAKVDRFATELKINYPLWVGADAAGALSKRLGNRLGVLPHTVILDPNGNPVEGRVGPYLEQDLEQKLAALVVNRR